MNRLHLAAAMAVIMITCQPGLAETALPRLQPAQPVFANFTVHKASSACNTYAGYGATVRRTVHGTILDPLRAVASDLARLFQPFFSDAPPDDRRYRDPAMVAKSSQRPPSDMVRAAGQKRLCD